MKRKTGVVVFFLLLMVALPSFLSAVTIAVTSPTSASKWCGTQTIEWTVTGTEPSDMTWQVRYYDNVALTWWTWNNTTQAWQIPLPSASDNLPYGTRSLEISTLDPNFNQNLNAAKVEVYGLSVLSPGENGVSPAITFLVDNTAPGITLDSYTTTPPGGSRNSGWFNASHAPVTVAITVTDADAGVRATNTVKYQMDGGAPAYISAGSTTSPFSTSFTATEGEILEIYAYDDAVDNTGDANEGYLEKTDYKVDLTAPSSNISVNYADRTFSLSPTDATSGIDWTNVYYQFVLEDDTLTMWYLYSESSVCDIPVGAKSLRVRCRDIAGNEDDRTIYFTSDRKISGYVKNYKGTALNEIKILLGGEVNDTAITNVSGYYEFTGLDPFGWYNLAPLVKNNMPAGKTYPGLETDKTSQNFIVVSGWPGRMYDRGNAADHQFDSSAILTPPLLTEVYSLSMAGTRMLTGVLNTTDNKMDILFSDGAMLRGYYYSGGAYARRTWSPKGTTYNLCLLDSTQDDTRLDSIVLCGTGTAVANIHDRDGVKTKEITTLVLSTDVGGVNLRTAPYDTIWSTNFGFGRGNVLFAGSGTNYNAVFLYNITDGTVWETALSQKIIPGTETLCLREAGKPVVLVGSQSDTSDLTLTAMDVTGGSSIWTRVFTGIRGKITPVVSMTEDGGWEDVIAVRTSTNISTGEMRVYVLNGATGEIKKQWAAPTGTTVVTNTTFSAAVADIDKDGKRELVLADGSGNIYVIDLIAGSLINAGTALGKVWAAVDFDGNADGNKEIIASYGTQLLILSSDLSVFASRDMGDSITNVVVSDVSGSGFIEIVVSLPARTSILRAATSSDLPGGSAPVIADIYSYGGKVYIVWSYTPTASGLSGFRIYRSTNPSDPSSWVLAGTTAADATSYIDSPSEGIYSYRVAAYNDYGELMSASSVPVEVSGGGSAGSGATKCFIATAAYGTPMAAEVLKLRKFRDEHLLTNRAGRAFVRWYYRHSPPVAEYISQRKVARMLVRAGLRPFLWILSF